MIWALQGQSWLVLRSNAVNLGVFAFYCSEVRLPAPAKTPNSGARPSPLFDTYETFLSSSAAEYVAERPAIEEFLKVFAPHIPAANDLAHARAFLKSYSGQATTFKAYRTQVERILLWSWIIAGKSILDLRRSDAERFMDFNVAPPASWVGDAVRQRFLPRGGVYEPNPAWRPFGIKISKSDRKRAKEAGEELGVSGYKMAQGSIRQVFSICSSFFEFLTQEDLAQGNPFKAIKGKSRWIRTTAKRSGGKSLTQLQWDFVIETAELMANEAPESHERTLFIVSSLFSMYLRVSDLVGNQLWTPTMGSFVKEDETWWYEVVGKGNVEARIAVKPDYLKYLKRYRQSRNLTPLPLKGEQAPLLTKLNGAPGLSDRQVRNIVQEVFDRALKRMHEEGRSDCEVDDLRVATLHWLRHTGATFDAPHRDAKNLQADLRHKSMSTTQDIYYNSLDDQRAAEVEGLTVKR
ncbi:tyrosine-type recombinase/integrase [Pseudomonas aeruginosa]|jgi:integrase|uniref:Tyrosine-type recombinase/integrase n=6 Tax=Pseudomonas TaxID=286 RepID=A0A1V0M5I9_PSEAI|nr:MULTISPECIES: tyrosine-type recombinase/integrase [Pseudomonas]MCP8473324.1 tyrosine-type recombinase/integrase [Pseudomonas triclosanedens]MCP8479263.1 tyrosine-type recombinase/integrase [Pseudomonas triclosanedens]AGL45987.1 site-specific recombinase, phage integrase family [Pseudomonas aeruginosa PA96]ARD70157.1 XERDC-like phage integrase [Pseudomonas aeruginosa]AWE96135.1 phage integrase family protein [Pseudomonas aeruginosa]